MCEGRGIGTLRGGLPVGQLITMFSGMKNKQWAA